MRSGRKSRESRAVLPCFAVVFAVFIAGDFFKRDAVRCHAFRTRHRNISESEGRDRVHGRRRKRITHGAIYAPVVVRLRKPCHGIAPRVFCVERVRIHTGERRGKFFGFYQSFAPDNIHGRGKCRCRCRVGYGEHHVACGSTGNPYCLRVYSCCRNAVNGNIGQFLKIITGVRGINYRCHVTVNVCLRNSVRGVGCRVRSAGEGYRI